MDRMTQDGMMQEHANRECWGGAQEALPTGAWMEQLKPADRADEATARMTWLLRTIEAEIIPRLMLAHQTARLPILIDDCSPPTLGHEDVVAFAALVLSQQAGAAMAQVEALRAQGVALEALYLDLLAPAARHLGELWEADLCDFTQVTLGLWRLQQVMHELSPAFQNEATYTLQRRRVLLAPAPGSQHTLGLFMVGEFFRRAGWDVSAEPAASAAELEAAVGRDWFDVVGLSIGTELQVEALTAAILALRKASRNKAIGIMVGGAIVTSDPGLVAVVGADATACDAPQAVAAAETLVARRGKRC